MWRAYSLPLTLPLQLATEPRTCGSSCRRRQRRRVAAPTSPPPPLTLSQQAVHLDHPTANAELLAAERPGLAGLPLGGKLLLQLLEHFIGAGV